MISHVPGLALVILAIITPFINAAENHIVLPGVVGGNLGTVGSYSIIPAEWRGQIDVNGPNITITGRDFKQIFDHLAQQPHYTQVFEKRTLRTPGLRKRYPSFILCNRKELGNFHYDAVRDAENYMGGQTGLCGLGPAKGQCTRVSCEWDSGVYFCNDASHDQFINCSEIKQYIEDIVGTCVEPGSLGGWFNGQKFRTDTEYSVLMGGGDLC